MNSTCLILMVIWMAMMIMVIWMAMIWMAKIRMAMIWMAMIWMAMIWMAMIWMAMIWMAMIWMAMIWMAMSLIKMITKFEMKFFFAQTKMCIFLILKKTNNGEKEKENLKSGNDILGKKHAMIAKNPKPVDCNACRFKCNSINI